MTTAEVALLISVLSLLLAAGSLGWQVIVFRRSGYHVKCVLDVGYVAKEPTPSGADVTSTVIVSTAKWATTPSLRETGEQQFFVTVTNSGRAAVWVESIGFTTGHRGSVSAAMLDSESRDLPYRLDAHQTMRWDVPMHYVAGLLTKLSTSEFSCTHAKVQLGDGRSIRTQDGITLELLQAAVAAEKAAGVNSGELLVTPSDDARPA